MKRLLTAAAILALTACAPLKTAPTNATPAQAAAANAANLQANWFVYCSAFHAAQPQIAARIPTAPLSVVNIVRPLADKVAKECESPIPANANVAVTQLTNDVTTLVVRLGIQQMVNQTQGAKK